MEGRARSSAGITGIELGEFVDRFGDALPGMHAPVSSTQIQRFTLEFGQRDSDPAAGWRNLMALSDQVDEHR
jgi:hypothetical protein